MVWHPSHPWLEFAVFRHGSRPVAAALLATALIIATAPAASAAGGSFNCGPSLKVRTNDFGAALHTHFAAGQGYQQNTGPNTVWVRHRFGSAPVSGSWSTTYSGFADCT
jgi:hypothetical protein